MSENAPATAPATDVPAEERTMGMLCHISAFAGYLVPFGNIIAPLVIWLIQKEKMKFVDEQGKESLNFQITIGIAWLVCIPLVFIIIGIPLILLLAVLNIVFIIIAGIKANDGQHYKYPFSIKLIK